MTAKILKAAAKIALPVLVGVFVLPAFAETVDFNTTGTFDCNQTVADNPAKPGEPSTCIVSPDKSLITITNDGNTVTIKAIGDSYTNVLAGFDPASDKNVVTLNDTSTANTSVTFCTVALVKGVCPKGKSTTVAAGFVGITGAEFTLHIHQTKCVGCIGSGVGNGDLPDSLSGKVFFKNTKAQVQFAGLPAVTIDHVTYTLDQSNYPLANPGKLTDSPGFGSETFTAQVTPEPTFMLLSGLGFAGLALVAYRRRRSAL